MTAPGLVFSSNGSAQLRFFEVDGRQLKGMAAFRRMPDAKLTVWAAGNQFFAMTRVIHDFQALHPGLTVGLVTLPPGLLLKAIQAHGWSFGDATLTLDSDVFASFGVQGLRDVEKISSCIICMHNALELMVAKGNPKRVGGLHDLTRGPARDAAQPADRGHHVVLRQTDPSAGGPVDRPVPGSDCSDCDSAGHVHFTSVHHREIPAGMTGGRVVSGWSAHRDAGSDRGRRASGGRCVPPGQDAADQVEYAAGPLEDSPHAAAAAAFIDFLGSRPGQDAYAAYGFLPATEDERTPRPLPAN